MLYVLWLLCFSAGLVAYATYQDCDPITSNRVQKPDQILPYLVMEKLTRFPGMPGVFVAAVYGGVLRYVLFTKHVFITSIQKHLALSLLFSKAIYDSQEDFSCW